MKDNFRQLSAYNRWTNARLYAASLHGILNHLLLTDRLWLKRLTGEGDNPNRLDAVLY
jgi:uncharacterized damage-inducible protein DinB